MSNNFIIIKFFLRLTRKLTLIIGLIPQPRKLSDLVAKGLVPRPDVPKGQSTLSGFMGPGASTKSVVVDGDVTVIGGDGRESGNNEGERGGGIGDNDDNDDADPFKSAGGVAINNSVSGGLSMSDELSRRESLNNLGRRRSQHHDPLEMALNRDEDGDIEMVETGHNPEAPAPAPKPKTDTSSVSVQNLLL